MTRSARSAAMLLAVCALVVACTAGDGAAPPASSTPASSTTASSTTTTAAVSTSTTAPAVTTTTVDPLVACLATWPLRERLALLVWPAVYPADWDAAQSVVRDLGVGGVVLMKVDDAFAADLGGHLAQLDAVSTHGVLVATDEEGGQVQRLRPLGVLPSQEAMSAEDDATVTATVAEHASALSAAGIDVVFAPVVDVRPADGSADPLGQGRLFAGDADRVSHLAGLYVQAWEQAGILPTLKHFPGHGSASADTHQGLAQTPPLDELRTWDLVPYERLAGSGAAVMVGHLDVPGLTDGEPASRSAVAVRLLRDDLGFGDALVVTDALGMDAVGLDETEAAVRALAAGIDVALFTDTARTGDVLDALEAAVADGRLPVTEVDDSALRVERLLAAHGRPCVPSDPG